MWIVVPAVYRPILERGQYSGSQEENLVLPTTKYATLLYPFRGASV